MEGINIEKKEITLEKFSEIFLDTSFDEEQFFDLLKNKYSKILKSLNKKLLKTIYFEYDTNICKLPNTLNSIELEEIHWNKKIIDADEETINLLRKTKQNGSESDENNEEYSESKEKDKMKKLNPNNFAIPNNSDFCIIYKAYKNIPDCLTIPLEKNGIARTKGFLLANLIWKLLKYDKMSILIEKLNEFQRYNHFPCTWQLGRKDNLWKNFFRIKQTFTNDFKFMPETFILPENFESFMQAFESKKENMWIIKPVASSRGRGIKLLTNINSIPKKCLVSKYISNPYLIENKKFDLRLYVLITSYNPLKIYLYNEGLVRFASEEYDMTNIDTAMIKDENRGEEDAENPQSKEKGEVKYSKFMHLTNYSVNKSSNNFDKNVSTANECIGSKWSLSAMRNYFKEKNLDFEALWLKIKDIVVKAVILNADQTISEVRKLTDKRNNLFEMYGFDIMIDSEINPWLLEINLNPSLNCDTELDIKIKTSLMTDILNIIGLIPYSHKESRKYVNKKVIDPKTLEEQIKFYSSFYENLRNFNKNEENKNCELDLNEDNFEKELSINNRIDNNHNNLELLDVSDKKSKNKKELIGNKNLNGNSIKAEIEYIKKDYLENKFKTNLSKYFDNYPFGNLAEGIMNYSNEEFSRNKNFNLLFPLKKNFEYYSQFILNPEIENIVLWSLLKDNHIQN